MLLILDCEGKLPEFYGTVRGGHVIMGQNMNPDSGVHSFCQSISSGHHDFP